MNPPPFQPKPGQIDFTHAREALALNSVVMCGEKILLLKRNSQMRFYPGLWSGVSGFLDDARPAREKIKEELREELGITEERILEIKEGMIFTSEDPAYEKLWIVHPLLVKLTTDEVRLDWEAEDYRWVKPEEAREFNLVPGFDRIIQEFLPGNVNFAHNSERT